MKILIIQCCDKNIIEYSKLSIPHNIQYALKFGYDYQLYHKKDFKYHPSWLKIECFKDIKYQTYDYIWCLDADAFINNFEINVKNIIDGNCIVVSENGGNGGRLINAGSIIYSNCIIEDILKKYEQWISNNNVYLKNYFWEQELINDFYEENYKLFTILDMHILNSGWKDMKKDGFIHHYMARDLTEKIEDMKNYISNFNIYNK